MRRWLPLITLAAVLATAPQNAHAWGNSGHRMIGVLAAEGLPMEAPAFLRTRAAAAGLGELAREPDRSRGAGKTHDQMRDPGHFIDIDDDGRVLGGPRYDALPAMLNDYETALRLAGTDSVKAGYLPYRIVDNWQQLTKDLAQWRVADLGVRTEKNRARLAWLKADRRAREWQVLIDLGQLAHYVGDAAYPLHVSSHYNGWGDGPNPKGYTTARIHVPLEGPFVARQVRIEAVRAAMRPYVDCACAVDQRVVRFMDVNWRRVEPFYALEKDGGFKGDDRRGVAFMTTQLAAGASELRDFVIDAWRASETMTVGYPAVSLADVRAGKITPYDLLYSSAD